MPTFQSFLRMTHGLLKKKTYIFKKQINGVFISICPAIFSLLAKNYVSMTFGPIGPHLRFFKGTIN